MVVEVAVAEAGVVAVAAHHAHLDLELLEHPVHVLERLEAALDLLQPPLLRLEQVDLVGELVEVERLRLERRRHAVDVLVSRKLDLAGARLRAFGQSRFKIPKM